MSDTATIAGAVPADQLLGSPAEMPTPTPGITAPSTGENAPAAPGADQPAPGITDRKGNRHDPLYHEVPARLNAEGLWAKRRGNAIRKAKGLPPSGKTFGGAGFQAAPPKLDQAPPAPAAPPAGASTPPPMDMLNGTPPPPVVDGVPSPEIAGQPLEAYEATAGGWVDGTLGIAQMSLGPAWEPKPQERTVLVRAVQRVLHHYQLPILGPVLELVLVVIGFAAKRKDDATTRTRLAAMWDWASRKPKAAPATYTRSGDQAAPQPPPAAPPVDAYTVTGGDAPAPSSPGRVAWG